MDSKAVAIQVIAKYLKKNKMAMCLRDILPNSGLSLEQRQNVADIAHDVVRWKRLYSHILEENDLAKNADAYVNLAINSKQNDYKTDDFEIKYSVSSYVASLFKNKLKWIKYLNEKPPTTLCVNFNKSNAEEVSNILEMESLPVEKSILETAVLTSSTGRYSSAVTKNFAHVQDESSQLISYFAVNLGDNILDFCAGNGGKSLAMASITRNRKKIFAYDINLRKRLTLEQRSKQYNAKISVLEKPSEKKFDVVFVDAPCTGIGAARRNPEAKYVEGSGKYPEMQLKILEEAVQYVKPEGFLFYTVCTFTPDETQEVVKKFLKEKDFKISNLNNTFYKQFLEKTSTGSFIFLPKGDIFFISLLKK